MEKNLKLITIRPLFDEVTEITFEECQEVVDYAKSKGVEVIDLAKEKAVRSEVEKALKENPHALVVHYDHGSEEAWYGSDEKPCIDLENVDLLKGRECYAQNCSSAKKLGVKAWELEVTYWGYRDVYVFTPEEEEYFKRFNNYGIKLHLDGFNWKTCLQKTKELATKLIDELVEKGKALAAACLRHDSGILVLYDKEHPPKSDCTFRKMAIKIFGAKAGWKISWKTMLGIAMFWLSLGIMLHDYCHECWLYGGYPEILSFQGFYVGFVLCVISFIILFWEHIKWLRK